MEIRRHDKDEVYKASRTRSVDEVYKASQTGSVENFNRLIEKDPHILRRMSQQTGKIETPLHVSALLGHTEFTKALCINNPKLAEQVDADGRTPLHLASAEGHKETVEALLSVYADACLRCDENGRIPLHYAAMRGEVEVLQKLIDKNPESIYVKVENRSKETVLHLCIIHNQLECLKLFVERLLVERDGNGEFLNSRAGCNDGVTILHLALMLRQIKTIRYLFKVDAIRAEAVGVNGMSLTMLDILEYSSVAREDFSRSLEIQQIFMDAGLIRSENNENDNPNSAVATAAGVVSPNPRGVARWFLKNLKNWSGYPPDWVKDIRGLLMVVATMISTMTFQAVVNPPGGVWDHDDTNTTFGIVKVCSETSVCKTGTAVLSYGTNGMFPDFIAFNTISFLASLSVTLLLVSGFPLHNRFWMFLLSIFMWGTLFFVALTYQRVLSLIDPNYLSSNSLILNASIFILLTAWIVSFVLYYIRFVIWVVKR